MQGKERLPIWRDANRLLLEIEQAVRQFPRYHKYTVGADLRQQAMLICRLLVRALSAEGRQRTEQVGQLRHAVDDFKGAHVTVGGSQVSVPGVETPGYYRQSLRDAVARTPRPRGAIENSPPF